MNAALNLADAMTAVEMLEQAVVALASVCDGAHDRDARGFNGSDAGWGHRASQEIAEGKHLDPVRALRVLSKYRKQLAGMGIELPSAEVAAAAVALIAPPDRPRPAASGPVIDVDPNDPKRLLVHGTFPRFTDQVKAVGGRKWMAELPGKPWSIPIAALDEALQKMETASLSPACLAIADAARQVKAAEIEHQRIEAEKRAVIVRDALARYEAIKLGLDRKPFDHQDAGIRWLIETLFAILADDMGLGKTYQALIAARALGHRVIVVCPAGLRVNWLREAEMCRVQVEVYSWAKLPQMPRGAFTLIADEAHYAQNMKSQRTKKFLDMADKASAVFLLSGTPVKNGRPSNLFPLLVAMKHPLASRKSDFEKRYCDAHATRWTKWDVTGAAHLEELHSLIADSLLRRMKTEVLDMPPKMRVVRDVRSELSAAMRERFHSELDRMTREYYEKKEFKRADYLAQAEVAEEADRDALRNAAENLDTADGIVELGILRHCSSLAKVETAVDMAEEVIEQGGQVIVFVGYKTPAEEIAKALGCPMIRGGQTAEERQAIVDAFQAGVHKAVVCMLGAGNVGITLTAARTVILLDRPWTPGDALQAEDRAYRIGQTGSVLAVWVQATESDVGGDAMLEGKYAHSETILEGERPSFGLTGDYSAYADVKSLAQLGSMLWKDRAGMLSAAE